MIRSLVTALGVLSLAMFLSDQSAAQQCPNRSASRGGGGGAQRSTSFTPTISLGGGQSGVRGGGGGGLPAGQLLTGPGSYFHDMMMHNAMRQQYARQQAYFAAVKQAKRNDRKQRQLETRRKQREAEVARREAKKRQAQLLAQLQSPDAKR